MMRPINEADWLEIMKVQAEAYSQIEPENLQVLQSKWLRSPEICFVYEKAGKVVGYLLAHSWNSELPPELYTMLPVGTEGRILFLHDLAISSAVTGEGLGKKMLAHLLATAKSSGFQQIRLVAVQDSMGFWKKHGFLPIKNQQGCSSYGGDAQLMLSELLA